MTPAPAQIPPRKPARTGLGWLIQAIAKSPPSPPTTDLLFPASERHPTTETLSASCLIATWSLAASLIVCLHSETLPASLPLRCLIAITAWLALIHSAVILPLLTYPLLRLIHLTPQKLATLTELTFLSILTLIACHLTTDSSLFARSLGLLWLTLIMAEIMLRLARSGIALASRPR
jgi:hypothetical protein